MQSSYEPIHHDETGALCGTQPGLGMDVHPGLRLSRQRLQETADFLQDLLGRLECIAGKSRTGCPAGLATGAGTGFRLVTEHIPEFARRGLCARDPKRTLADGIAMRIPRKGANGSAFKPYSPAVTLPYAHRWRLFRTPNDAFLAANTHREGSPLFDILQPAYAALYSGAIHPTAEAHAIVADHVLGQVRAVVDRPDAKPDLLEQGEVAGPVPHAPRGYSRTSLETGSPRLSRLNSAGASPTLSRMHSSWAFTSTPAAASTALSCASHCGT